MLEKIIEAPLIVALIPIIIPLINVMSKSKEERLLSQKQERIAYRIGLEMIIYVGVIVVCFIIPKGAFIMYDAAIIGPIMNFIVAIAYLNLVLFVVIKITYVRKYILEKFELAETLIVIIRFICLVIVMILSIYILIIVINVILSEVNRNLEITGYTGTQINSLFELSSTYFNIDESLANRNEIRTQIVDTTGMAILILSVYYVIVRILSMPNLYIDNLHGKKENICDIVLKEEKKVSFEMATYIGRNKEFIIIRPKEDPDVMYINVNEVRTIHIYEREA